MMQGKNTSMFTTDRIIHRKKPLAEAVTALMIGATSLAPVSSRAELPVPSAAGLVAPGRGAVLPPVVRQNKMTITQTSDRATLDWASFNIGAQNAVRFQQPGKNSIALNNIHDNSPSSILGTLSANGQVYLVNQNGFMFGPNARVNTNSLVVSTLNVTEDALQRGLSNAINNNGSAALVKDSSLTGKSAIYREENGQLVKRSITIAEGAQLKSQSGGRILVVAPSIENRGTINTPNGQAILAAAYDKVYLQAADSEKTGVRGLLVEVATGGNVSNLGKIAARRGDVTMEGFAVNQKGIVSATTSVNLNGSIRLLAREKADNAVDTQGAQYSLTPNNTSRSKDAGDGLGVSARVVLDQGSTTNIKLEKASREKAVDSQTQTPSQIEIMGRQVDIREAAKVNAPAGKITISATSNPFDPASGQHDDLAFLNVKLGAKIDASGVSNVSVPVSKNIVEAELRGFELRDSPLQKDKSNPLYGKIVYVDSRKTTNGRIPIADVSGSINRVKRNISERSVNGGSINLISAGSTTLDQQAVLNVSGGSTRYRAGWIPTTQLRANGKYYDINTADPNRRYDGVFGTASLQNSSTADKFSGIVPGTGRYEPGYVQGADGGKISILTDTIDLKAQLLGKTIDGFYQRNPAPAPADAATRQYTQRAIGSSLDLELGHSLQTAQSVAILGEVQNTAEQLNNLTSRFTGLMTNPLVLMDRYLERTGISHTTIHSRALVAVHDAANLNIPAGGSLALQGSQLELNGRITAPAGSVSLNTTFDNGIPVPPGDGSLHLSSSSRINTSGIWTNDLRNRSGNPGDPRGLILPDAGPVNITADGRLKFDQGSEIAADGSAWLSAGGKLTQGKGGAISLTAQQINNSTNSNFSNNLDFQGTVHAYALQQGGTLNLTSNGILVGSSFSTLWTNTGGLEPVVLSEDFFNKGGFSGYNLTSNLYGIAVGYDTSIRLKAENLVLKNGFQRGPTGENIRNFSTLGTLADAHRQPVNLSLNLTQAVPPPSLNAAVTLDKGSRIQADPGAAISLKSDSRIVLNGTIDAPAGSITAQLKSPEGGTPYNSGTGIFLGSEGKLLAAGAVKPAPTGIAGIRNDLVLNGGSITLKGNRGYIGLAEGSLMDVSGTSTEVDQLVPSSGGPGFHVIPVVHASKGGSIALSAPEAIFAEGQLMAKGNPDQGAAGGSLSLTLNKVLRGIVDDNVAITFPTTSSTIEVRQRAASEGLGNWQFASGLPLAYSGVAHLAADTVQKGGFDALNLTTGPVARDKVNFVNNVSLKTGRQIVLETPTVGLQQELGQAASNVQLNTVFMAMGTTSETTPYPVAPLGTGGPGTLSVAARDIELTGSLSLQGSSETRLAAQEDFMLRGVNSPGVRTINGELQAYGNLTLGARQIFPSTLTRYTINLAGGPDSRLAILGNGKPEPVLSAGGTVNITAPNIEMGGAIEAPFGKINLTAGTNNMTIGSGGYLSVSSRGKTIPFGLNEGGIDWVYGLPNQINLLYGIKSGELAPPTGSIEVNGPNVNIAKDATVDISGGGQLYSREFLKNAGGSVDLLNPNDPLVQSGEFPYQEKFAILPWMRDRLAPYDPLETAKSGLAAGDSIYIGSGVKGLAAGSYTLLPASYALLPGAFLVTPDGTTSNAQPPSETVRLDQVPVIAAQRGIAGTKLVDFGWQGYAVQTGGQFRKTTAYANYYADSYFGDKASALNVQAPYLPKDAGSLQINAGQQLNIDGTVLSTPAEKGIGGRMDISAEKLRIVSAAENAELANGEVALAASQLNALKVDSLLIGGNRQKDLQGNRIGVSASTITVDNGASLTAPELMLAATDRIDVKSGAKITASGKLDNPVASLQISNNKSATSDGAFLRVSAGTGVELSRDKPIKGTGGNLNIEEGAVLSAAGSIALDATGNSRFGGQIDLNDGSLWLGASRINLGAAPTDVAGLSLSDSQLSALKVSDLALHSNSEIGSYGSYSVTAKNIDIKASGLVNSGQGTGQAQFTADTITLANASANQATDKVGSGTSLKFNSKEFSFAGGNFSLAGFNNIEVQGTTKTRLSGTGQLIAASNLDISTPVLTTTSGADTLLFAAGHAININGGNSNTPEADGIGGKLTVAADAININTTVAMPSGQVNLKAANGITIGSSGTMNLQGLSPTFAGKQVNLPGGSLSLSTNQGNINLANGSTINISGQEQAGSLSVSAPNGTAILNGNFNGKGQTRNAALNFDLGQVNDGGNAVLSWLASVGKAESFEFRLHQGNLAIAQNQILQADLLSLATDNGSLTIAGTLDASGTEAGQIDLSSGDEVRLSASAQLLAGTTTENGKGGSVFINSVDQNNNGLSGIQVDQGALINVRGGQHTDPALTPNADQVRYLADGPLVTDASGKQYMAGEIHLRALRDSLGNGTNIPGFNLLGTTIGTPTVQAEAVKVYDAETIDTASITSWETDTRNYMDSVASFSKAGLTLLPGVEVRHNGNITLADKWDLVNWRYGADNTLPGFLTIRAGGNLSLNASVSDGLAEGTLYDNNDPAIANSASINDLIQPGLSWSLNLVAGSDSTASNPLQVLIGTGDLNVGSDSAVRTGTGNIALNAGNNLTLAGANSAIYTVGQTLADASNRYGVIPASTTFQDYYAEYPTGGGNIRINSGGNIVGAVTPQLVPDWQVRARKLETEIGVVPLSWGIAITQRDEGAGAPSYNIPEAVRGFKENIGALAGGNIAIKAGGSITDLSAVIPTVGKPTSLAYNQVEVHGGGNLSVSAGDDISGGLFYVEKGQATLSSGGSIQGGSQYKTGPVLSIGDTSLNLVARSNLDIGSLFNMSLLRERNTTNPVIFSTYTDSSSVNVASLGGGIHFQNDYITIDKNYRDLTSGDSVLNVQDGPINYAQLYYYPGNLNATAASGSITLERSMTLAPNPEGKLELLAGDSIKTGKSDGRVYVNLSDADSLKIPVPLKPSADPSQLNNAMNPELSADINHALTPVHNNDPNPVRIVAQKGDISGPGGSRDLSLFLSKRSIIEAGNDILNVNLGIQNLASTDISSIQAGRDVGFAINRNVSGQLENGGNQNIRLAGPGSVQFVAGRNVDLGSSDGILSTGNTLNPALPTEGAAISLLSGVKNMDAGKFLKTYAGMSDTEVDAMSQQEQIQKALPLLFAELQKAGIKAASTNRIKDYDPGYKAIASLFPEADANGNKIDYQGDINLFFSQIQTLAGGDINLLAPGGMVNAGLSSSSLGTKSSSQLGIVVQQAGAINSMVKTDFTVNESRVFALGGGNIAIWASDGNIDAGKGAKSALSVPPPQTTFDSNGNVVVVFPPAISGSGIQTASSSADVKAGNAYLFAPRGVVDAGDAGISIGGNITIGATAVVGASNISVGGTSTGVPTAPPPPVIPVGAASAGAAATKQSATEQGGDDSSKKKAEKEEQTRQMLSAALKTIQVDLVGFGDCSVSDVKNGKCGS